MDQSQNRHSAIMHGRIALHGFWPLCTLSRGRYVDKRPQWGRRQPMYFACKLATGSTEHMHMLFLILVPVKLLFTCLAVHLSACLEVVRTVPYRPLATQS